MAGIRVRSNSSFFLAVVALHVAFALICVAMGVVAMVSAKRGGRHPRFGTLYYWSLAAVFASATILAAMRWAEDWPLFVLGALAYLAATVGRAARRGMWRQWATVHVTGMGASYILLLTAFYVDNGKNLPVWRDLPTLAYWLVPSAVGLPLIAWALVCHPVVRSTRLINPTQ